MIYYRLAFLTSQTGLWCWRTTMLTSLRTVLQRLRTYGSFPQDQIRVFFSRSKECLEEMLQSENRGLPSGSATAEQFLRARHLQIQQGTRSASMQKATEQWPDSPPASTVSMPNDESRATLFPPNERGMSFLDRKPLEIERGPGGDHDMPYRFSFPMAQPQLLAWLRLQASTHTEKQPDVL